MSRALGKAGFVKASPYSIYGRARRGYVVSDHPGFVMVQLDSEGTRPEREKRVEQMRDALVEAGYPARLALHGTLISVSKMAAD